MQAALVFPGEGERAVKISLQQLSNGHWQVHLTVLAGDGSRYFCEEGNTPTAALVALRQSLRGYQGPAYVQARRMVLDQFATLS
jgi:hypothetical protein